MVKIKAQKYTLAALVFLALLGVGVSFVIARQNNRQVSVSDNKPNSTDKNKSASEEEAEELEPGKVTPPATTPANQPSPPPPSSSGSLPSPTGQVLNKNLIRLSSTEPQYDPNMNSTCQTLVGATCGVRATLGSKVINIPAVAVDDRGVASIDWNAKAAGLTPGVWDIQVVATKDGKAGYSQTDKLTVEA